MKRVTQEAYWQGFGRQLDGSIANSIWRRYSDSLVTAWLIKHLPSAPMAAVLKTDLFEEAVGAGIRIHGLDARHRGL